MKRIISLSLAVIIAFSVITLPQSVSAHDFSYEQMADMLNSMDILHGDGTGYNFEGMLTRAQFTKLAITSSQYKNSVPIATHTSPYNDVKYTHWAAGYIKTATANSVISGYPDATFRPEGYVKTEEAVTILLKLLGYTNEDFGGEWPYGQMGIASNIGLMDNVTSITGGEMTRLDAIAMIYNMLTLNSKDGTAYITKLGYKYLEDIILIASSKEDTTVDTDSVYTSSGLYKVKKIFDFSNIGRCGDAVLKTANNELAGFFPSNQNISSYTVDSVRGEDIWISDNGIAKLLNAQSNTTVYEKSNKSTLSAMVSQIDSGDKITVVTNENGYISYLLANLNEALAFEDNTSEVYAVAAVLGDSIIVNDNGTNKTLTVPSSATAYYDSSKTTFGALASKAAAGDVVSVARDSKGEIRYVSIDSGSLDGPYTAKGSSIYEAYNISSQATILKEGMKISAADILINDITYYSSALNTVWVYSDKKTGIYEDAYPNTEFPTSIILSGTTYEIESSAAYSKLASGGSYGLGSTVTLLLGRNGKIADVISPSSSEPVYGYVLSAGKQNFENNSGSTYTSYYVEVVTPDGSAYEYNTKVDYSSMISNIVRVTFKDSYASLTKASSQTSLNGVFSLSNMKLGTSKVASDVKIIDVKSDSDGRTAAYIKTYPARLNGIKIMANQILYAGKNSSNEINELILKNVTGDTYDYGIIVKNSLEEGGTYILNGAISKLDRGYTVKSGTPVKLDMENGSLYKFEPLNQITDRISYMSEGYFTTASGEKYYLSDKVSVYKYTTQEYMLIPLSDVINNNKYTLSAYYDKTPEKGGRIRIIIAR